MSENDHQPVKLTGLLLLAAIALVFLAVIWLIGTASRGQELSTVGAQRNE